MTGKRVALALICLCALGCALLYANLHLGRPVTLERVEAMTGMHLGPRARLVCGREWWFAVPRVAAVIDVDAKDVHSLVAARQEPDWATITIETSGDVADLVRRHNCQHDAAQFRRWGWPLEAVSRGVYVRKMPLPEVYPQTLTAVLVDQSREDRQTLYIDSYEARW